MTGALYTHTTRATGTVLTAAIYNGDHQNHITYGDAQYLGGWSNSVAQMRGTADPGESGLESLSSSISDELERLRFAIQELKTALGSTTTYWYETAFPADATARAPLPPGYINGLDVSVVLTKTNFVQVAPGWCRSLDDACNLTVSTAREVGITGTWVTAATGNKCGVTMGRNTWGHVFLFKTAASTFDIGLDTVLTASNLMAKASLAASDSHYRRIGSVLTATTPGTMYEVTSLEGDAVYINMNWANPSHCVLFPAQTGGASLRAASLKATAGFSLVPTGFSVRAQIHLYATGGGPTGRFTAFSGRAVNVDNAPAEMLAGWAGNGPSQSPQRLDLWTSPNGEILLYTDVTGGLLQAAVLSYYDPRRS